MRSACALLLLLPLAGCGPSGPEFAPVSGRVTLNKKPLANVRVEFAPIRSKGSDSPGPTSAGRTDADGRFTLVANDGSGRTGAVLANHVVRVSYDDAGAQDRDADPGDPKGGRIAIPARYGGDSELRCEVAAGGKSNANFDLTAP